MGCSRGMATAARADQVLRAMRTWQLVVNERSTQIETAKTTRAWSQAQRRSGGSERLSSSLTYYSCSWLRLGHRL